MIFFIILSSLSLVSSIIVIGNMTGDVYANAMESVLKASTSDNLDNKLWSQNGNNAKEGPVDNHVDDTDNQNTIEDRANNNSPVHDLSESQSSNACDTSLVDNACQSQQQLQVNQEPKSDDSCLFHPEQEKCKPDQITGKCPPGFSMNENEHRFPDKPCPQRFEKHDNDETGACYPIIQ
jgi:hypothetical protein